MKPSIQLIVIGLITCMANSIPAATSGNVEYIDRGTYIELIDYLGYGGVLTIPETISGKPVREIKNAFLSHDDGVTQVIIPAGITTIGYLAFDYCDTLYTISVDSGNPNYSSINGALCNKSGTTLISCPPATPGTYTIPSGITRLDPGFFNCQNLTQIVFSNSVQYLHFATFNLCPDITDFTVSESNPYLSSTNGILFNKNKTTLIRYPATRSGPYTVPESIELLDHHSFFYCRNLTGVIIPATLTDIDFLAFSGCRNLQFVFFQGNAPSLNEESASWNIFEENTTIYYVPENSGFSSPEWTDYTCMPASGDTILPSGVSSANISVFESWIHTNAPAWKRIDFTDIPSADFELAWLVDTIPENNLAAMLHFQTEQISVESNRVHLSVALDKSGTGKNGIINGWMAVEGSASLSDDWQTVARQTENQSPIAFSNGHASVSFEIPPNVGFFRPKLQMSLPSSGLPVSSE